MKLAIFDFDGTIFDSAPYWDKVLNDFLIKNKITDMNNIFSFCKPLGLTRIAVILKEKYNLKESVADIIASWRLQMGKNYHEVINLKEGVVEYIQDLKQKNIPICIATAMEREFVMPALIRTNILDYIDLVITIADIEADKSTPKIFQYCAEYFELSGNECMVFEDSHQVAKICLDAGFNVTGVYDGVCENDKEIMVQICDRFIDSFNELLKEEHNEDIV